MKRESRMPLDKAINDGRNDPPGHWFGAADPQFPARRVGQMLDRIDTLSQLIEHRRASTFARKA
jgi:hypothetical protein